VRAVCVVAAAAGPALGGDWQTRPNERGRCRVDAGGRGTSSRARNRRRRVVVLSLYCSTGGSGGRFGCAAGRGSGGGLSLLHFSRHRRRGDNLRRPQQPTLRAGKSDFLCVSNPFFLHPQSTRSRSLHR